MITATQNSQAVQTRHNLPKKLHSDAIVEALCQIRFNSPELPEVVIGRLTDYQSADYISTRLPFADIPYTLRQSDPHLRHQPIIELKHKDGSRLIRVGEDVISYHIAGSQQYCGWDKFHEELTVVFKNLFDKLHIVEVTQLGLRYINALEQKRHHVSDVHDLNFTTVIDGAELDGPINLNYVLRNGPMHTTTTRIAHKMFVQGAVPEDATAIVDVEVNSTPEFEAKDVETVMSWVTQAHEYEKSAFFKLLPREILEKLVEI